MEELIHVIIDKTAAYEALEAKHVANQQEAEAAKVRKS